MLKNWINIQFGIHKYQISTTVYIMDNIESLAERLGFDQHAKVLIIRCEGLGMSHSTTVACYGSIRDGIATTTSLMVPAPWSQEASYLYRGEDVGVDLTFNSDFDRYRWGPLTLAPSLLGGDGGFPRTPEDLWEHGDIDEVTREARAQIERAILWGFDVSHLTGYLKSLHLRPEFFQVYLDMAIEFKLPIRLSNHDMERVAGFPFRSLALNAGIIFPDHIIETPKTGSFAERIVKVISELKPGVSECVVRPALESDEIKAITQNWEAMVNDYRCLTDPNVLDSFEKGNIHLIGYRELKALMS